ncbi:MAG: hypothetical protein ACI4OP_05385 [Candidatus Coprovivens sp.]
MKEKITDEYGKFETIAEGLNNQLCTLLLTDIVASLVNVYKDDKGEIVKDYSEFDTLVNNVKELLDSVQSIPSINIRQATKDNLEQINRMYDECRYSMRTLQWIKEDLLKEDNKDA